MILTLDEAVQRYGAIDLEKKHWPREREFMEILHLPDELIFPNWLGYGTKFPVKRLYCNKDFSDVLLLALSNVKERNLGHELKTFDGLFNIRSVRGFPNKLSAHCYGLAIDINASENPLGGPIKFSQDFAKCFIDVGFTWGGNFHRIDAQHFSYAWE